MKDVTLRTLILPMLCLLGATALPAQENNDREGKEKVIILRNNDLKPHPGKESVTFYRLSQTDEVQDVQRAILGIYPGENGESPGLLINELVNGGGAAEAGIQAGDRILEVNGKQITDAEALRYALSANKPGDEVRVLYVHGDKSNYAVVKLTAPQHKSFAWRHNAERDPCKVFIGVYTHTWDGGAGVKVDGVINGTSAETAGLKENDVILALDDVAVSTHEELVRERDKHKAGDFYTLTIRRDNLTFDVDAQFKECPTDVKETATTTPEPVVEDLPVAPQQQQPTQINAEPLQLDMWKAFPNPTYGQINVRFQTEPVPTGLQITDSYGRVVYREQLNNFDGNFDRQLNLSGATPGMYTLSVQQGDKVFTEKIVLLPKA